VPEVEAETDPDPGDTLILDSANALQASDSISELVNTEVEYIKSLRTVISYLDTIRKKQLLNRNDTAKMFSNIEEIHSVHLILIKELNGGSADVGTVFLKMIHYLKVYSVYCANYPNVTAFLQSRKVNFFLSFSIFFSFFSELTPFLQFSRNMTTSRPFCTPFCHWRSRTVFLLRPSF